MDVPRYLFTLALSSTFLGCDAQDPPVEQEEAFSDDVDEDIATESDTASSDDGADDSDGTDGQWQDSEGEPYADQGIGGFNGDVDPAAVGFPTSSCRSGFSSPLTRICTTPLRSSTGYLSAQLSCRSSRSRVCTREDYFYIYSGPNAGQYNANGRWLGNTVGDDQALCGNRDVTSQFDSRKFNFDGTCNVGNSKQYRCCHDRE